MKKTVRLFLLFAILLASVLADAQTKSTYSGIVVDNATNKPLADVNINLPDLKTGTVTDASGNYKIQLISGKYLFVFSCIGYETLSAIIELEDIRTINDTIRLSGKPLSLGEIRIMSSYITDRKTPVAINNISSKTIERVSTGNNLPEILNGTPGIYSTKEGGGSGDERLSLRGFQQENIAVLLNGIPVSSMENGLIYWSNWAGLADATEYIQVQKGLGASKTAMNSVGGTINLVTKSSSAPKSGIFRYFVSNYGNQSVSLQLTSGKLKNGINIIALGSYTFGNGYIDGTYVKRASYYLSASKEWGSKHRLVLTLIGSPDKHGQHNFPYSQQTFLQKGNKYNGEWGYKNGELYNLSENFYHKPQLNLNHFWNISDKLMLASGAYVSTGKGGGHWYEQDYSFPSAMMYNPDGQVSFDSIVNYNRTHTDTTYLENGSPVTGFSKFILTDYRADHYWAGILSNLQYTPNEHLKLTAGIHARTFRSHLYEQISDLLGGNYWIDHFYYSAAGVSGREELKSPGDIINTNNYSYMKYGNLFVQAEYSEDKFQAFATASVSETEYRRRDLYNYIDNTWSERVYRTGFDVKTGAGYHITPKQQLYINAGFYSREPLFKFVFPVYTNYQWQNISNEKIVAMEAGYNFSSPKFNVRINGYITNWLDKSETFSKSYNSVYFTAFITGMSALHKGIEIEAAVKPTEKLSIETSASFGNWKWSKDATAVFMNNYIEITDSIAYYKDLYVGGAPQVQVYAGLNYEFPKDFSLHLDYNYYDRLYTTSDPSTRTITNDRIQSYRLPSYALFDGFIAKSFNFSKSSLNLQLGCRNIFNTITPTRGEDNYPHTIDSFKGFWTFGRTADLSLRFTF